MELIKSHISHSWIRFDGWMRNKEKGKWREKCTIKCDEWMTDSLGSFFASWLCLCHLSTHWHTQFEWKKKIRSVRNCTGLTTIDASFCLPFCAEISSVKKYLEQYNNNKGKVSWNVIAKTKFIKFHFALMNFVITHADILNKRLLGILYIIIIRQTNKQKKLQPTQYAYNMKRAV